MTETGRPFFVMELVKGLSITEFCDKNKLTIHERLELFISVCHAVQHAHQRGIIHRDIKPTNILVTLHDGKPIPKVIDFGIAKALNQQLTDKTIFTRHAQMIGTPVYMSPEQAEMRGVDIDTRTDVFSLGVVLYELLTGTTPFDSDYLLSKSYGEIQRIIRDEEPMRPSVKLTTLDKTLAEIAKERKVLPDALRKLIQGDLDWIVMKTLEKDRTHRYKAVHALAEDIERYLKYEPITASSPGTVYRLRKFFKRNRAKIVTWSAMIVIATGLLLIPSAFMHIRNEQIRADHTQSIALVEDSVTRGDYEQALTDVTPILSSRFVGPEAGLLHARILLELQEPDASVAQLDKLLNEPPEIAANAHFLLARIYLEAASGNIHMKNKAEVHLEQGEKMLPKTAEAYVLRAVIAPTIQGTLGWLEEALQLDPGHFSARRTRALTYFAMKEYHDMETEASVMIGSQPRNHAGYALRAIARRELATIEQKDKLLNDALKDHNKAIALASSHEKHIVNLYHQRSETLMQIGQYEYALSDIEACLNLKPRNPMYHFNRFCVLLAQGQYENAQAEYNDMIRLNLITPKHFDVLAAQYVSDSLWSRGTWYPDTTPPQGKAFDSLHKAAIQYHQLAKRAERVVAEGFHPSFSPDGSQLAYSRGEVGASGIEILELDTGKTKLLTVPGKDPAWSPDGQYIAYVRDRQFLSMQDLTFPGEGGHRSWEQEEIWIIKADGSERPRSLAKGGWPHWSGDSSKLYYHSRMDKMIYALSIDRDNAQPEKVFACKSHFPVVSPNGKFVAFFNEKTVVIVDLVNEAVIASWEKHHRGPQMKLMSWSKDSQQLAIGCFWQSGLWIYDIPTQHATQLVEGSFAWSDWSASNTGQMAMERVNDWHHEIWITKGEPDHASGDIQMKSEVQSSESKVN